MEQEALDRDGRIIDGLRGGLPLAVALQTAVAVDAVANAVQETVRPPLDRHRREIVQIPSDVDGRVAGLSAEIRPEIVARSGRRVPQLVRQRNIRRVVEKAVQRPVAACQENAVPCRYGGEKCAVVVKLRQIGELRRPAREALRQLFRPRTSAAAARKRIIQNVIVHVLPLFRTPQRSLLRSKRAFCVLPHGAAGDACFSLYYRARRSAAMAKTHEMWRFGTNARKCGIW